MRKKSRYFCAKLTSNRKRFQLTDAIKLPRPLSQWGVFSLIEYHVFLSVGGQNQQISHSSSHSFEDLISSEVENHQNDNSPTYFQTISFF